MDADDQLLGEYDKKKKTKTDATTETNTPASKSEISPVDRRTKGETEPQEQHAQDPYAGMDDQHAMAPFSSPRSIKLSAKTTENVVEAKHFIKGLCLEPSTSNANGIKVVDLQWGVDLFFSAVTHNTAHTSAVAKLLLLLPKHHQNAWDDAVYKARRWCENFNIEFDNTKTSQQYKLMNLFAHTSIEDSLFKKVFLPVLVDLYGDAVLNITLSYGNNKSYLFSIWRYCVGMSATDAGVIETRHLKASFSFFHTEKYQIKLSAMQQKQRDSQPETDM